jgi:hypothetical protein
MIKTCSKCKETKETTEFHKAGAGFNSWCKSCRKAYFKIENRKYYSANTARYRARGEIYRNKNKARIYAAWLRRSYWPNLTITEAGEEYTRLLRLQNNVCAICYKEETVCDYRTGKPKKLAVDHAHNTGIVRGLLCQACNHGLGVFEDDPSRLHRAAAYLG